MTNTPLYNKQHNDKDTEQENTCWTQQIIIG